MATFNQPVYGRKPGSVGRAIWGCDVAIVKAELEGELGFLPSGELGEICCAATTSSRDTSTSPRRPPR